MPSLSHALLTALKDQGAHEIFGIPGDYVLPLFKVIEESNILPSFTLSHEQAVGFAADASARYHGGFGVVVVTYGAGALNTVNSIAGAYAERSPAVVIAGAPAARERASGFLLHHQARTIDTQLAVFKQTHLRSGGAGRSCNRTCPDRACVAQRAGDVAAGLSRISS
jgi:indolepyruvate decarboxylase